MADTLPRIAMPAQRDPEKCQALSEELDAFAEQHGTQELRFDPVLDAW